MKTEGLESLLFTVARPRQYDTRKARIGPDKIPGLIEIALDAEDPRVLQDDIADFARRNRFDLAMPMAPCKYVTYLPKRRREDFLRAYPFTPDFPFQKILSTHRLKVLEGSADARLRGRGKNEFMRLFRGAIEGFQNGNLTPVQGFVNFPTSSQDRAAILQNVKDLTNPNLQALPSWHIRENMLKNSEYRGDEVDEIIELLKAETSAG